jgi:2-phospho-L-lactate guanylyltransferase
VTCWAIIPVKGTQLGKQRLAGVLGEAARGTLVRDMLDRVVVAVRGAQGIDRIALVGSCRHGQGDDVALLPDPGMGLNPAISSAVAAAQAQGATRVVVIFADLPQLTAGDVELLAAAPEIALAPDRHETGTNALSLPLPGASGFTFGFGPDSFARHRAEADRIGLSVEVIRSPGLQRDIDEPADLPDAAGLRGE